MKVLLMAYECSPYRGSEWAVGWGRLLQAAREFETHVITSESNYEALTRARGEGLVPANVEFYTPEPDARLRRMERKPALFAYNYTAYHQWQKLALPLAQRLHAEHGFAVVHQVTVGTFREPGYTWTMGVPYVWGPVGGTQNFPWRFLTMLPAVEAVKEGMRGVSNWLSLRMKGRVRAAAKAAAVVIGANSTNQRDYAKVFGREVELLLETGLRSVGEVDRSRFVERAGSGDGAGPLKILWSGELQTRKALPILLRALASLGDRVALELTVLGDGPMRGLWEAEVRRLGLTGRVEFAGRLPFAEAVARMQGADLFCFTSLRDTSGNVVLESLAAGVPVVCFDHQGAGDLVDVTCGVKIAVSSPKLAVEEFARVIAELARGGDRMLRLSEGATERAKFYLWDRNGDWVNAAYRRVAQQAADHARVEA